MYEYKFADASDDDMKLGDEKVKEELDESEGELSTEDLAEKEEKEEEEGEEVI
jgi:hypothetical protein